MKTRALLLVPLVVALALHGWASGAWAQDAVVAALLFAAIPLGGLVRIGRAAQRALAALFFAGGAGMGWAHAPELGYGPGTLPRGASLVALGALLAAASRFYVRASWKGERATFVLGLLAVAACGTTKLGPAYGAIAGAYLALSLHSLRLRDDARAPLRDVAARHGVSLAVLIAIALAVSSGLARAIPVAHDAVQRELERAYVVHDVVGFGTGASLGSIGTMMTSDEEVLRVSPPAHAAPIDYLRGAVYDEYRDDGLWGASVAILRFHDIDAPAAPSGAPATFHARRIAGDDSRYFVPLGARELATSSGRATLDATAVARAGRGTRVVGEYSFALGGERALVPMPPTAADLGVPRAERARLAPLARDWTRNAATDEAKLDAIRARLARDYRYSLTVARESDDPILDFLFTSKVGYCTYFASATTLLARVEGIPARMVAGYRVAEWDPVTREWIVREKNAHAWVEAWVDGAWRTVDATPMSELPQDAAHLAPLGTLVADAIARAEATVAYSISHMTPAELLAALVVLAGLLWAIRALRARAGRRVTSSGEARVEGALPCYERLAAAVARGRAGHAPSSRAAFEPLERFAARLRDAGDAEAADLVERYAALRYGGFGDAGDLDRDVDRFLAPRRRAA